ncbi:MAG: hypothetical protein EZS28_050766, partial [Streblomastix strix]
MRAVVVMPAINNMIAVATKLQTTLTAALKNQVSESQIRKFRMKQFKEKIIEDEKEKQRAQEQRLKKGGFMQNMLTPNVVNGPNLKQHMLLQNQMQQRQPQAAAPGMKRLANQNSFQAPRPQQGQPQIRPGQSNAALLNRPSNTGPVPKMPHLGSVVQQQRNPQQTLAILTKELALEQAEKSAEQQQVMKLDVKMGPC